MKAGRTALIWYWGRRGGGPQMVELLVEHLVESGFKGRLALSLSAQNERLTGLVRHGFEVHLTDTFRGGASLIGLAGRLASLRAQFRAVIRTVQPDIILVPMMFGALPLLADIARGGAERLVYVVHDVRRHAGDSYGLGQQAAQRILLHLADEIVTASDTLGEALRRRHPALSHKVAVVPLAGLYRPRHEARPAPSGPVRFLLPGRLVRYKGYDRLAEALRHLDGRDFTVTIAGDGPYRRRVERLFGHDARVALSLGWQSPEAHAELFRTHDLLLCPYDGASQSGLVCEALAAAMPAIVTPVGALPEQIGFGRAGLTLPSLDPADLARAMAAAAGGGFDYAGASAASAQVLRAAAERLTWTRRLGDGDPSGALSRA